MIGIPESLIGDLRAISLFSGCGGLDLGVASAGFQILASVEIDPHAVASLNQWTNHLPYRHLTYHQDIRLLDPWVMMRECGLEAGTLDLLVGGPPCQSFSGIGFRRGLADPRGLLLFEMVRFAEVLLPKAIVIEQVKGLVNFQSEEGQGVLAMLQGELERLGYGVSWRILNAADYGVPQSRQRIFIVALRNGALFSFPKPTHVSASVTIGIDSKTRLHKTLDEVIQNLPDPVQKGAPPTDPNHIDVTPSRDRERIHHVPEGEWLAAQLHLPAELRGKLSKKDTTKYRRLSRHAPALTLRCGEIHYHPTLDRYLTPREYLRLHGYPDWFELAGPIRSRSGSVKDLDQHRQVANSVPPPLAGAIASRVKAVVEDMEDAVSSGAPGVFDQRQFADRQSESARVQMPLFATSLHRG